jgi:hypothetical protein
MGKATRVSSIAGLSAHCAPHGCQFGQFCAMQQGIACYAVNIGDFYGIPAYIGF